MIILYQGILRNPMKNLDLLNDMLKKQLKTVPSDKKLKYNDLKRLCKYINNNIFDENKCCIWNGYVTNMNNENKGVYINFYFKGKKAALHRLLYINFVQNLTDDEYLKFTCDNKGKCCNITHLNKFKYAKKEIKDNKIKQKKTNNKEKLEKLQKVQDNHAPRQVLKTSFTLNFD